MKSRIVKAFGTTLVGTTAMVTTPGVAHAALGDCPSNYVCMWEDSNYSGDMWVKYQKGTKPGNKVEIDWWNGDNEISSLSNKTDLYLVVFADDDWNGSWKCINPNTNLSSLSGSWNDNIESFFLDDDCVF